MFAGMIDKSNGAPWGHTGLDTAAWMAQVVPTAVKISELVATQPGVYFAPLIATDHQPLYGDPYPHVVRFEDTLYLEDGHSRVMRALLRGKLFVWARVLEL